MRSLHFPRFSPNKPHVSSSVIFWHAVESPSSHCIGELFVGFLSFSGLGIEERLCSPEKKRPHGGIVLVQLLWLGLHRCRCSRKSKFRACISLASFVAVHLELVLCQAVLVVDLFSTAGCGWGIRAVEFFQSS